MEIQESITVRFAKGSCRVWAALVMCVFSAFPVVCGGSVYASDDLEKGWMADFQTAEAAAKKAGVPMVVHFWAPWCGPCRNMEAEVLTSHEVQAMLGNGIVGVKVNSDEHRDLVSRFGVTALPTDVFVSPEGKVLSRSVGSPGRQGYLAKLTQYRAANPAPASSPKPQTTAVAQAADTKVETVTAAKPVFEEPKTAEKSIVGLSVANDDAKTAEAKPSTETEPAKTPEALPVAKNKALRKDAGLRIGLNGYSPVALTDTTKWQKGDAQFTHNFQGVRYQLSSAEELEKFKASPDKFIPALHGCDPVSLVKDQVVQSGFVELGASFRSRRYFFSTKASRDEFLKTPEKFASAYNLAFFEAEEAVAGDTETKNSTEVPAANSATTEHTNAESAATEQPAEPKSTEDAASTDAAESTTNEPAAGDNN
jgi:thiol-disulfide isomerase/thioredoxin/YHS domain-containing protein